MFVVYLYQQYHQYFAQVGDGIEDIAIEELTALGADDIKPAFRGLYFNGDAATLYRVNYHARLITRVLAPLVAFDCHSAKYLYRRARELPWTDLMRVHDTFAVFANVSNSAIRHSQYAALRVKDAIVDTFRDATGKRPNVEPIEPDVWVNLHLHNNRATISLDTSGGSLHRRGYRQASVEAPMQETVAAAMVHMSGWDGTTPLVDPMCGSGTILCEAAMRGSRVPAGWLRARFGFQQLPDFDAAVWETVRREAEEGIRPLKRGLVGGSDVSADAVAAARRNCRSIPHGADIDIVRRPYGKIDRLEGVTIVTNPPYGQRIGKRDAMPEFMKDFGDFLKRRCTGSTAYIYFGKRELLKFIGLRPSWKRPLANGGLDGRLARFELF